MVVRSGRTSISRAMELRSRGDGVALDLSLYGEVAEELHGQHPGFKVALLLPDDNTLRASDGERYALADGTVEIEALVIQGEGWDWMHRRSLREGGYHC